MIRGRCTPEATEAYARAHPAAAGHYRIVRGLTLSSLGLGSYLGQTDEAARRSYEEAVLAALERGVNVLDTALNYRDQLSERDLGRALARHGRREEVFVATKGGFLAPDAESAAPPRDQLRQTFLESGMLRPDEIVGGMHAMSPRFLDYAIARSRTNLGLETLDLYFLHNPETQLAVGRLEFERRLRAAFVALERRVEEGSVASYGLATWDGFRVGPEAPNHLSLERVLRLAQEARAEVGGGTPNLAAVELPVNLGMPEAHTAATQLWKGKRVPFLAAAKEAGLIVFASATLLQTRLLGRLPPFVRQAMGASSDVEAAIQFTRSVPGVTTALVGMGDPEHARANADLARQRVPRPEGVSALTPAPA